MSNQEGESPGLSVLEDFDLSELEEKAKQTSSLYHKHQTTLRNLVLCYMHALTQSNYELSFWDNGAIKSIAPRGER